MKIKYLYLALSMPFISLMSCSDSTKSKGKGLDSISDTTSVISSSDSLALINQTQEKKEKTLTGTQAELDYMRNSGNWSKYESGILPQMAQDAPEYCGKVLNRLENGKNHFVIVDKAKMHLFLYDKFGNVIKKYPIACAKNYGNKRKWGDSRTNEGYYDAEGVYDSTNWHFTNDRGYTSPAKGVYGPWFIRVVHPIGIHGTSSPSSIGKRCSHGCIRVNNEDIKDIIKYVDKGTPIIVSPGPKDMAVNAREGAPTFAVVTEPGTPKATAGNYDMSQVTASSSQSSKKKTDENSDKTNNKAINSKNTEEVTESDTKPTSPELANPAKTSNPVESTTKSGEETQKTPSSSESSSTEKSGDPL